MDLSEILSEYAQDHPWILTSAAACFSLSLLLMHATTRAFNLRRLTIPTVFYFTYLVMIFLPSFWVYVEKPSPYRDWYMIAVISLLLTLPLGILTANAFLRFRAREIRDYFEAEVEERAPGHDVFLGHLLLVLGAIGIACVYVLQVGTTPLQHLIANPGDVDQLTLMREQTFKLLDPRWETSESTYLFYAYLFLRTLFFPFLILSTFGYYQLTRQRNWLLLFLATFTFGCLYAASSIARAPVAAIFMRLFFFLYVLKSRLSMRLVVVFTVLIISFPLLITAYGYGTDTGLLLGFERIALRFTYTPAEDLYYYFEIFPDHHDYLYGHTLIKPFLKVVGADYFYIENYVHRYISPNAPESGHANAAFLSNLHADFGLAGVIFGGFFVGWMIQAFQIYTFRQKKTVYSMALYAFLVYAIWALNFGSITSILLVNGMLPILFMPALMKTIALLLRRAAETVRSAPA